MTFDTDAALQRIREARGNTTTAPPNTDDNAPPEVTDLAAIGARMNGHPYEGDELAALAVRMFRN